MRLCVVSHVIHYEHRGDLYAYGPYVREMDIWADLFSQIVIASPCRQGVPPKDALPFSRSNVNIVPQREVGGQSLLAKLRLCFLLPLIFWEVSRAIRSAEAVHVRCPGNLGLVGALVGPLLSRYRIAKYAGQWNSYEGEFISVKFQRRILRSRWWGAPVTVYGSWPDQPSHVKPFFTSVLEKEHLSRARDAAARKRLTSTPRILYVGRLTKSKNVHVLLGALVLLRKAGILLQCEIIGDGPYRSLLEQQACEEELVGQVKFRGALSLDNVLRAYERCDVMVLVSETEGWPKALAEAMTFGLICIGSDRGFVPQMLDNGRGIVVPPGNVQRLADALRDIARNPEAYVEMRTVAAEWGQRSTLDDLRTALMQLIREEWNVNPLNE